MSGSPEPAHLDPHAFTILAITFELFLLPVAWLMLQFWSGPPLERPEPSSLALGVGVLATLPLLIFLLVLNQKSVRRLPPIARIHQKIRENFGETFAGLAVWQIVVISAAAGIGEEILFRGVIQPRSSIWMAALIFGLLHWVTPTYAVLATAMGLYLGWIYEASDNIIAPVVTHALYDAAALVLLRQLLRKEAAEEGRESSVEAPGDGDPSARSAPRSMDEEDEEG